MCGDLQFKSLNTRKWIAYIFVPGLYLCLLFTAVLSLVVAGLLVYCVYEISLLIGRIPVGFLVLFALGGIAGVVISVRAGLTAIQRSHLESNSIRISPEDAPGLFSMLSTVCGRMNVSEPGHVLIGLTPTFFVTETEVETVDEVLRGRSIFLSAPLLRLMSLDEIESVLCHELAHFTGFDTVFSRRFYPVYRGTTKALSEIDAVSSHGNEGAIMSAALIIPMWVLSMYLFYFGKLERKVGRERELRADSEAARHTNSKTTAAALLKVHAFSPVLDRTLNKFVAEVVGSGRTSENLSKEVVLHIRNSPFDQQLAIDQVIGNPRASLSHPFDSHPSFRERIDSLGIQSWRISVVLEEDYTDDLFVDLGFLEQRLTISETSAV